MDADLHAQEQLGTYPFSCSRFGTTFSSRLVETALISCEEKKSDFFGLPMFWNEGFFAVLFSNVER